MQLIRAYSTLRVRALAGNKEDCLRASFDLCDLLLLSETNRSSAMRERVTLANLHNRRRARPRLRAWALTRTPERFREHTVFLTQRSQ